MEMLLTIAGSILVPILLAAFGWLSNLAKRTTDLERELRQEVNDLELKLVETYASRAFVREVVEPLRDDIDFLKQVTVRIASKLHITTD